MSRDALRGPGVHPPHDTESPGRRGARATRGARPTSGAQRQAGYRVALVRLPLGDITAGQLRALAALARAFGDGAVRLTPDQNLFMRWVPATAVHDLFDRLAAAGLAEAGRVARSAT